MHSGLSDRFSPSEVATDGQVFRIAVSPYLAAGYGRVERVFTPTAEASNRPRIHFPGFNIPKTYHSSFSNERVIDSTLVPWEFAVAERPLASQCVGIGFVAQVGVTLMDSLEYERSSADGGRGDMEVLSRSIEVTRCGSVSRFWAIAVLLALTCTGCGGCGSSQDAAIDAIERAKQARAKREEEERLEQLEHQKNVEKRRIAKEEERRKEIEARKAQVIGRRDSQPDERFSSKLKAPSSPRDVSLWKKKDYVVARRSGDPRLVEALRYFSKRFAGNRTAAEMLIGLLDPATRQGEVKAGTFRRWSPSIAKQQTEALVSALAANGTERSRDAIEALALGKLPADDVEAARRTAIQAILADPLPGDEALLMQAMFLLHTEPLRDAKARGSAMLRGDLFRLAMPNASAKFRLMVAEEIDRLVGKGFGRREILGFLMTPEVANIEAQALLYRAAETEPETNRHLESHFTSLTSANIGALLEVPKRRSTSGLLVDYDDADRRKDEKAPDDDELALRVAECLWTGKFVHLLRGHLNQIDSIGNNPSLIALASTVPDDSARRTLYHTLSRNWRDGPSSLGQLFGSGKPMLNDPGWMVSLKIIARESEEKNAVFAGKVNRHPRNSRDRERETFRASDSRLVQADSQTPTTWTEFSGQYVLAWCDWLQQAANARAARSIKEGREPVSRESLEKLPIRLHEDARVVAHHEASWPSGLPSGVDFQSVSPLKLHYVRIEQRERFSRLISHYRRQMPSVRESSEQRGVWLDCLVAGDKPETCRSIDILIRRDPTARVASHKDERLRIDVLVIEISDPSWEEGSGGDDLQTGNHRRPVLPGHPAWPVAARIVLSSNGGVCSASTLIDNQRKTNPFLGYGSLNANSAGLEYSRFDNQGRGQL